MSGACGRVVAEKGGCEHERESSACVHSVKESQEVREMKEVMGSSAVMGTVVMVLALVAADVGGPVVWAGYWGAGIAVLSRV